MKNTGSDRLDLLRRQFIHTIYALSARVLSETDQVQPVEAHSIYHVSLNPDPLLCQGDGSGGAISSRQWYGMMGSGSVVLRATTVQSCGLALILGSALRRDA